MTPIPKPKTYEEFKNPSITLQKRIVTRIFEASNQIWQNQRRTYSAELGLILHEQIYEIISEYLTVDDSDPSLTLLQNQNGQYIAGVDPVINDDDLVIRPY